MQEYKKKYRRCKRCIMDNQGDDLITFDEHGFCNYCTDAIERMKYIYFPDEIGQEKLNNLIEDIKKEGKSKKYDCIMGISGGLDSSYLAMLGNMWGLRILALHIDDGFDSEIAKLNIEKLCDKCALDLITIKPSPEQYNDLTRAYFFAKVPNIAIPQDNILLAHIYKYTRKYGIRYFLTGGNFSLESILQKGNTYTSLDVKNIKAIHEKFGSKPMNNLLLLSERRRVIDRFFYGIKTIRPLNYINYNKERAIEELMKFCDFDYYESKHLENTLTKVIQLYWLYHKFGVDKRKSHLSSLIISEQISRDDALVEMKKPMYDSKKMEIDIKYVLDKIHISRSEFEDLIHGNNYQHTDYPYSRNYLLNMLRKLHFFNVLKNKLQS